VLAARAVLAVTGLTLGISACSAGQQAQTASIQATVDGANADIGPIALRDIKLAYPDGGRYTKGSSARLEFVAVNDGDQSDELVDVRTDAASRVTLASAPSTAEASASATASGSASPSGTPSATGSASGSGGRTASAAPSATASAAPTSEASARIPLPSNNLVAFRAGGPSATLVGLTEDLLPAQVVRITFAFRQAGEVTADVPVGAPLTPVSPPPMIDVSPTEE